MASVEHAPEHPLPEELQKMARDDTVCKFCGISYLIHNEIKALEDRVKSLDQQLSRFIDMEMKYSEMKEQMSTSDELHSQLRATITAKDSVVKTLQSTLEDQEITLQEILAEKSKLSKQLDHVQNDLDQSRERTKSLCSALPRLSQNVRMFRDDVSKVKQTMQQESRVFKSECENITKSIHQKTASWLAESFQNQTDLVTLQKERQVWDRREQDLESAIKRSYEEMASLKKELLTAGNYSKKNNELDMKNKELQTRFEALVKSHENIATENNQNKMDARIKGGELSSMHSVLEQKEHTHRDVVSKLKEEIGRYKGELTIASKEILAMRQKEQFLDEQKQLSMKSEALTKGKTDELRSQLERCRSDIEALHQERQLMIEAHQAQIEQLRNSFRLRISELDHWPEKLENAIQIEKEKSASEVASMESKLRENFISELQIEKQKHQKLLEKYNSDASSVEAQLKAQARQLSDHHHRDIAQLKVQLAESSTHIQEVHSTHRIETGNLKSIINDLENKLSSLDSGNDVLVSNLSAKIEEMRVQSSELSDSNNKLQIEYDKAKDEVFFLQETVRRECEERFELTDALSTAKEELLALKRFGGNGGYSNANSTNTSPILKKKTIPGNQSHRSSVRSEELVILDRARRSKTPRPPSQASSGGGVETLQNTLDTVTTAHYSIGYEGEPVKGVNKGDKGTPRGAGMKGNSLRDSRQRINDAMGRK